MNGYLAGDGDNGRGGAGGNELAPVPDAERWQRIADLAVAHQDEADRGAGDPDETAGS